MGEKDVVGSEDEVARRAFLGNGADDLLDLDLQFSLDISLGEEKGVFVNVNVGRIVPIRAFSGTLPNILSGKWFSISSGTPYFADAL